MRRSLLAVLIGAAMMMVLAASALAEPAIGTALAKLKAQGNPGNRWCFVVMGDTRNWVPIKQSVGFITAVPEVNVLHPDLALDIGDLILGYTTNRTLLNKEWDGFFAVADKCEVPFFPVVGNHDVTTQIQQDIWEKRLGPMYYSFRYGKALFVCLSSDEAKYPGEISPKQVDWVAKTLKANQDAQLIFAFVHQPLWLYPPKANWGPIQNLLKAQPAKTKIVFGGHWHLYTKYPERDGVQYVICGGGGAEIGQVPEEGDFHHYLFVQVKGDQAHWAVIKQGAIEPENIVTLAQATEVGRKARSVGALQIMGTGQGGTTKLMLPITNKTKAPLRVTIGFTGVAYTDSVTPSEVALSVPAGATRQMDFTLKAVKAADALKTLTCVVTMTYDKNTRSFQVHRTPEKAGAKTPGGMEEMEEGE